MTKQYLDIKSSQLRTKSTTIKKLFYDIPNKSPLFRSIHDMFTKPYTSENTELHIIFSSNKVNQERLEALTNS
jgi:hypothetical protein